MGLGVQLGAGDGIRNRAGGTGIGMGLGCN